MITTKVAIVSERYNYNQTKSITLYFFKNKIIQIESEAPSTCPYFRRIAHTQNLNSLWSNLFPCSTDLEQVKVQPCSQPSLSSF